MTVVWTILAFLLVALFVFAVVWWGRRTGPSTSVDETPSQPPAGPGAEGMRVLDPGEITTGSDDETG